MGSGLGNFNASSIATFNLDNPIYRDVATVPKGGWLAIRFLVSTLLTAPNRLSLSHVTYKHDADVGLSLSMVLAMQQMSG